MYRWIKIELHSNSTGTSTLKENKIINLIIQVLPSINEVFISLLKIDNEENSLVESGILFHNLSPLIWMDFSLDNSRVWWHIPAKIFFDFCIWKSFFANLFFTLHLSNEKRFCNFIFHFQNHLGIFPPKWFFTFAFAKWKTICKIKWLA